MKKLLAVVGMIGLTVALSGVDSARAADEKEKAKKTEVEGTWKLVKGGKGVPKQLQFSGNKFVLTFDKERVHKGTFTINTEENPSWMDMKFLSGPTDKFKNKVALCIYKFDGDGFTWCASIPGRKRRSQQFASVMGDARLLLGTYKKVEKE